MSVEQPVSNKITINTAEQDHLIDSVTVFQARQAEIKRRVELDLKKGQNQVDIERLPNCIHEDSIRVQGSGTAVIFDVVYHSPTGNRHPTANVLTSSNNEISKHYNSLQELRKKRSVIENQTKFLDSYGSALNNHGQGLDPDGVERFLDMYDSRRNALDKRIQELDLRISQEERAYNEAQDKSPQDKHEEQRRTKITVTVFAEVEGTAELHLTYVVSNASWTPVYDVRASISQSPNTPSKITLHYRASITQTTGENWREVALTLSTASPEIGTAMPTLSTWRVGVPTPSYRMIPCSANFEPLPRIMAVGSSASQRQPQTQDLPLKSDSVVPLTALSLPQSVNSTVSQAQPSTMNVRQADTVDTGMLSATFNIPGRSNIPSDESIHKVLIALLDLQAEPEWVCIPRKNESVFLMCTTINSSGFVLLPGQANVFMDDNFVSKSTIQHVPPNAAFKLPLGTDPALRVTYAPARTFNRTITQSGFFFPGWQKNPALNVKTYSQHITVRNSRATAVSTVHVLDHVPVSDDATIKVNITSPQGLAGPSEDGGKRKAQQLWVNLSEGIRVRWAPADAGGDGLVQWACAIGAGQEVELELGWEVSTPVRTYWETP